MPRRVALLVASLLGASFAGAQGTVSGVVRDSLARRPLPRATVQLVPADDPGRFSRLVTADSLGRFAIADVPDGRYTIGFFHPVLDSLGIDAPLREVVVEGARSVRVELATPSPARLRTAICSAMPSGDAGGVVVGVVRAAQDGAPAAGVRVTGEWVEYSLSKTGVVRRAPRLVATTGDNGWFALCNVPVDGSVFLAASRGADSTDLLELRVPAEGLLRRELFIGPARVVAADTARRLRAGDGRVAGTVIAAVGGRPLAGALVHIVDGAALTRTNERGEWTLTGTPAGTRMLEVRAVGYYPVRRAVDVVPDAAPVRVTLSKLEAVLDTIRVAAARTTPDNGGFDVRRRTAAGHYLTATDIARLAPIEIADVFMNQPALRMQRDADTGERAILMRSPFGACSPGFFVDGSYLPDLTADELNAWARPDDLVGIEIYTPATVPAQFRRELGRIDPDGSSCGSIVIWTKRSRRAPTRR